MATPRMIVPLSIDEFKKAKQQWETERILPQNINNKSFKSIYYPTTDGVIYDDMPLKLLYDLREYLKELRPEGIFFILSYRRENLVMQCQNMDRFIESHYDFEGFRDGDSDLEFEEFDYLGDNVKITTMKYTRDF